VINIREEVLKAKESHRAYIHKGYWKDVPSWQEFLNCIFKEIQSEIVIETAGNSSQDEKGVGNVVVTDSVYFSPQVSHMEYFSTMSSFLKDFENTNGIIMGVSGPKISVGPRKVDAHSDQWDAFSLQCQGTTIWTISYPEDGYSEEFHMEPGDLLFFPKETMHELYCEEPRAGIIFNLPDVRKTQYRSA
jgi:hypothetical protein